MKASARFLILVTLLLLIVSAKAQIISGPLLGYTDMREICIRLEVDKNVKGLTIKYRELKEKGSVDTNIHSGSINYTGSLGRDFNPIKIVIGGLKMNTRYNYDVLINGKPQSFGFPLTFKTKKYWGTYMKEAPPEISFLMGSCTYLNDSLYDRPGKPYGQDPIILNTMAEMPADFMIWNGDNLYLREADYGSEYGIRYRYSKHFSSPYLKKLMATRPNYATWDDHDYGPDDSNLSFDLKKITTECFKNYWANKTYGEPDNEGIYGKFEMYDSEFFLLDDRYHRSANQMPDSVNGQLNPDKHFLGVKQMNWLKNSLISSKAIFKFVFCGSQVLNPMADKECMYHYKAEYRDLIQFIVQNKINGVIFMSGDRHFSELIKIKQEGFYDLYDFTCSPITSGLHIITEKPEFTNPNRVEGSLLQKNNFGKISISGTKGNRYVKFQTFDKMGAEQWTFSLNEKDLKVK